MDNYLDIYFNGSSFLTLESFNIATLSNIYSLIQERPKIYSLMQGIPKIYSLIQGIPNIYSLIQGIPKIYSLIRENQKYIH